MTLHYTCESCGKNLFETGQGTAYYLVKKRYCDSCATHKGITPVCCSRCLKFNGYLFRNDKQEENVDLALCQECKDLDLLQSKEHPEHIKALVREISRLRRRVEVLEEEL